MSPVDGRGGLRPARRGPVLVPRAEIRPRTHRLLRASVFVLLIAAWTCVTSLKLVDPLFLPSPWAVAKSFANLLVHKNLLGDVAASVYRVSVGFTVAALIATPLGMLMGTFQHLRAFFEPLMGLVRYMPAAAFIPLLIAWTGIGDSSKFAIIFLGTFFHLTLLIQGAAHSIPMSYIDLSHTLGASRSQVLRTVVVPACLPAVLQNLRITLGWAWTYIVVAEMVAANSGIGYVIMQAGRFLRTDEIFVGIMTIGILGVLFDLAFEAVERWTLPYVERDRAR